MSAHLPFIIVFAVYGLILIAIASFASKFTKNLSDYLLGNRSLSGPIVALSAGASDMSGWLLMALPGLIYVKGLSGAWLTLSLLLGAYCNWKLVAKRLRIFTEVANNSLTLPAFFANRFANSQMIRLVTSIAMLIFFTCYSIAGFNSAALLLQAIFGLNYVSALAISSFAIISYTAIGGFLAVSWIDFFQGMLMLFSLITVPVVTIVFLGGIDITYTELYTNHLDHLSLFANVKPLAILSLASWGLGYFGQPHIVSRFMAIRAVKELGIAKNISLTWMGLSLLGAVTTGLIGVVFFVKQPLINPDTVFIVLSKKLFPPIIAGILLSAVLSAIMSTVSAQIHMSSGIVLEDFYRKYIRPIATDVEYVWVGRLLLIVVSIIPAIVAASPNVTILQAVGFAWSGLGAAFGPVTLFSLYWSRMNKYGAIAGISVGTIVVLVIGLLSQNLVVFIHPDLLPGYEILPAFILSGIAIVVVSLCTAEPDPVTSNLFIKYKKVLQNSK